LAFLKDPRHPPGYRTYIVPSQRAKIIAIGTAVPDHDIHNAFIDWAASRLPDQAKAALFRRMAGRSGIKHRFSVLPKGANGGSPIAADGFYADAVLPPTSARMTLYAQYAPDLAMAAIDALAAQTDLSGITHLVVASCTGFVAPGIDQIIASRMGLSDSVERLLVGFMGCYAAIAALRSARHIVRSEREARVLVVTVEISTLHLQDDTEVEPLLAMLQFGDGAAAALVTAHGEGLVIERPFALNLPESEALIRWTVGDQGFAMHLSGEVPARIAEALRTPKVRDILTNLEGVANIDDWAVHAGGRSILDSVSHALALAPDALDASRAVLANYGNMSSATLMFALVQSLAKRPQNGVAIAFGPGLACEGFGYVWADDA
jgi:predicted naringenin-chalcone synthase